MAELKPGCKAIYIPEGESLWEASKNKVAGTVVTVGTPCDCAVARFVRKLIDSEMWSVADSVAGKFCCGRRYLHPLDPDEAELPSTARHTELTQ